MRATHGYRVRSPETWARARADYRSGFTAAEIAVRHGLGLSAVRARVRREAWRGFEDDVDLDDCPPLSPSELAALAWSRLTQALRAGCATEARRWLSLHEHLIGMACDESPGQGHGKRPEDGIDACAPSPAPENGRAPASRDGCEVQEVRVFLSRRGGVAPGPATPADPAPETRARSP